MITKASQTGVLIILTLLYALRLNAQEQAGDTTPYSFVTNVPISMNSELTRGTLVDIYWTGVSPEYPNRSITRFLTGGARLLSANEVQPPRSIYPNTTQFEISVEFNAETIRVLQSLPVEGRFSVVKSRDE